MADVFNNAFPQTGGGGGTAATPTITVTDNEDGTATVTVAGLTTESVTVEYFQAGGSWLTLGSRVGNGTVTAAVTGAPGTFWFVATADDMGDQEMSEPVMARITTAVTITPAYWLSLELHNLRESIVASACWKAIVELPDDEWPAVNTLANAGTSDAAAARAKVILERTDEDDADEDPPRCIIRHASDGDIERLGGQAWSTDAQLLLLIELPVPSTLLADKEGSLYDFDNKVGRMMSEILLASESGSERLGILRAGRGPIGQIDPKMIRGESLRMAEFLLSAPGVLV